MCKRLCWAAFPIEGVKPEEKGIICKIEGQYVPNRDNSYKYWCTGDYSKCPTWRAHNREYWVDQETDVNRRRKRAIEEQYGPTDEVADSFMEGTGATLEDVINTEI